MNVFEFATDSPWWTLVYLLVVGVVVMQVAHYLTRRVEKR